MKTCPMALTPLLRAGAARDDTLAVGRGRAARPVLRTHGAAAPHARARTAWRWQHSAQLCNCTVRVVPPMQMGEAGWGRWECPCVGGRWPPSMRAGRVGSFGSWRQPPGAGWKSGCKEAP
jgi:hypothetical protein